MDSGTNPFEVLQSDESVHNTELEKSSITPPPKLPSVPNVHRLNLQIIHQHESLKEPL